MNVTIPNIISKFTFDCTKSIICYFFLPCRGRELQRRLSERVREADFDAKDRNKEQEELDELKNKIFSGEFENPTQEFERVSTKQNQNRHFNSIIIIIAAQKGTRRIV
jgi:RNA-binding protein 25